jgi:hypothetical protein
MGQIPQLSSKCNKKLTKVSKQTQIMQKGNTLVQEHPPDVSQMINNTPASYSDDPLSLRTDYPD